MLCEKTIISRLTLREILATDTAPLKIDGYLRDYILLKYGGRYPIGQTLTDLTPYLTNLMSACASWLASRATLKGLDVDLTPLIEGTVEQYETPMTSLSSEDASSRTIITTEHAGEYMRYMLNRLGLEMGDYETYIDSVVTDWWSVGNIICGYRRG